MSETDWTKAPGWNRYRKTHPTWAIKLPIDVVIPTREGEVEGEAGDYLCIDKDGGMYPCDTETFEAMYEPWEYGEALGKTEEKKEMDVEKDG